MWKSNANFHHLHQRASNFSSFKIQETSLMTRLPPNSFRISLWLWWRCPGRPVSMADLRGCVGMSQARVQWKHSLRTYCNKNFTTNWAIDSLAYLPTFYLTFWAIFSTAAQQQIPFCMYWHVFSARAAASVLDGCSVLDCLLAELSLEALFPHNSKLGNNYEFAKPSPYVMKPPLRTNQLRTWGYPCSYFPDFPPIALKNPRVGWKILPGFLSNGSTVPQNQRWLAVCCPGGGFLGHFPWKTIHFWGFPGFPPIGIHHQVGKPAGPRGAHGQDGKLWPG